MANKSLTPLVVDTPGFDIPVGIWRFKVLEQAERGFCSLYSSWRHLASTLYRFLEAQFFGAN